MSAQVHALKAINSRVEAPEEGAALFGPVPFKVYTQRDLERIIAAMQFMLANPA